MATSGSWSEYVYGNSTVGAGSWKVTASRGGTSSTATVTVSLTITESWGKGNEYDYYLYVNGSQRASNTSIHYEGSSCTLSYTYYPSAADAGGSISGNLQFRAYLVSSSSYSSKTGSYTVSYGSKTTYTISYNANGGSGAPSSQTKYYGTALTLSSTKPTRSGYDFLGWSTSSTATSATWSAGGSYTTNASNTLYAVWKASTSTIISATEQVALSMDSSVNALVTWKPNDSSFKFRITASIPASVGTAYTVTFPSSSTYFTPNVTSNTTESIAFDSVWISKITKDNSATCTLTLYTYNSSGTQLGSGSVKDIKLALPTDRLSPTVSISSISKTTNFFTKYCIGLDAVQIAWNFTPNTGASLKNGIITVDGQTGYPTSTSTYSSAILSNIGSRNIIVSAEDQRGNISNQVSSTIQVYKYFYPDVNIKYLPNKKLDITGNIAYVAGENQPKILLSIYEGNSSTPVSGANNLNITNSGTWAGIGETYEKYYPINFGDGYDVSTLIPNIDTTSYKFQVKVYDSVTDGTSNYVIASTISATPIMTFNAGGTGITAHKPVTFEQTAHFNEMPTFEDFKQPVHNLNINLTSSHDLDDYKNYEFTAWCDNVVNKPQYAGRWGRIEIKPFFQRYHEYYSAAYSPIRIWERMHVNSVWTTWVPVSNVGPGYYYTGTGNLVVGNWATTSYTCKVTLPIPGRYIVFGRFKLADESTTYRQAYRQLSFSVESGNATWLSGINLGLYQMNSTYNNMFVQQTVSVPIEVRSQTVIRPYVHTNTVMTYNVDMVAMYLGAGTINLSS